MTDVNQKQVGGTHYNQVNVQHWDLVILNKLPYLESQISKYITRWQKKNQAVADIEKSGHYLEKLVVSIQNGVLKLPTVTLTSIQSPRANPPVLLEEFAEENGIGPIEKTIFYLLLTYTTMDGLTRVSVLLQHLLVAAKEMEAARAERAENVTA